MHSTVHRDKGAEVVMESFVWPVDTVEITFWETAPVRQLTSFQCEETKDEASGWGVT